MPVYQRYAEDLTGTNPDNRVEGEVITLNNRPIRIAMPKYGPFYTESLTVYDNVTQQPLTKGVHYRIPSIVQEATLQTGKEVADFILIIDENVSSTIRCTTQVLGGGWQRNIDNLIAIYESYLNDSRTVDWVSGIYNKPDTYPPPVHPTWLSEIFGFGPVTVELERIANAIQLGNAPAFELIIEAVLSRGATIAEMNDGKPLDKLVTLEGLLYVLDKYNFNSTKLTPEVLALKGGEIAWFDVVASNVPKNVTYYWTIQHINTTASDFQLQSGIVTLTNGIGRFSVQTVADLPKENNEVFKIALRRNSVGGQIIALSQELSLKKHSSYLNGNFIDAELACCPDSPLMAHTVKTYLISRSLQNAADNY